MNLESSHTRQAIGTALIGLFGLASAMGIGRFAFTPILPLMQSAGEMNLIQGSWLASINYLGYLLGALACIWLVSRPALWAKYGLLAVALMTLAMAFPNQGMALWLLWRLLAGIASAFVLVGVSAWCLDKFAATGHEHFAGWVYAGVGVGVALAGFAGLGAGVSGLGPDRLWAILGVGAAIVWLICRHYFKPVDRPSAATPVESARFSADSWRLIACYGIFGIGYILPATFLPAMARARLPDPAIFGWVWPVFGMAAALSTVIVSRFFHAVRPRRVWAVAALIMTLGVAVPLLYPSIPGLIVSALCVGGTFMVMTMAGLQEARAAGGATLIAALTAGFATGQVVGPLLIDLTAGSLLLPSVAAAMLLLISAFLLWPVPRP